MGFYQSLLRNKINRHGIVYANVPLMLETLVQLDQFKMLMNIVQVRFAVLIVLL